MNKLQKLFRKNRERIIYFALGIIATVLFLWLSSQGRFTDKNLELEFVRWSNITDSRVVCADCENNGMQCFQNAEFMLNINGINTEHLKGKNKELQCKMIIDDVDLYKKNGKYFCNIKQSIESSEILNISSDHDFMICCGSEGLDFDALKPGELQPSFVCKKAQLKALCSKDT